MKNKIKVNRNYILSHPFIKITKDYKYKLEANNGVNRSSWSVKDQLYIINNIKLGVNKLSTKLERSVGSIRNKVCKILPPSSYTLYDEKGKVYWDVLHAMKEKLESDTNTIADNLEDDKELGYLDANNGFTSEHNYDRLDASLIDLHHQLNILYNRTDTNKKAIKKLDNSIGSVEDNMQQEIAVFYDRFCNPDDSDSFRVTFKIVKGFGFWLGYGLSKDSKNENNIFSFLIGFIQVNIGKQ